MMAMTATQATAERPAVGWLEEPLMCWLFAVVGLPGLGRREGGGRRQERVVEDGGEARKEPGGRVKCCRRRGERRLLWTMLAMSGRWASFEVWW